MSMKKEASKMTLEKLAMMVANGFAHIEEKMATKSEMNKRFEEIEKNLQTIHGDILNQDDRFVSQDVFNTRISVLEAR